MFEVTHKMHHIGNRTDHEMFDHFYPSDNKVFRYIQWYGILTGLHYLLVPVGSFMIAAVPWLFHTRLFKKSKFSNILFDDFKGWVLAKVRLETLFIIAYWATLWILLGFAWQTVLIFYVCFGFNWSTRQYVTHAWTPRDVMEGAANLKASRVMGLILLNGQWDHAHHRYPFLPWTELTNEKYHVVEPVSYFSQYLSLWKGPRMTLVPGPSVMAEADQIVDVIYE
jgi:fatty acid desaturase